MRYVNLLDHYNATLHGLNSRDAWKAALATCKASKIRHLYVPWETPVCTMSAADKPTAAEVNAGLEPPDWNFARFKIDFDLKIYGDGNDAEIPLVFNAPAGLPFTPFKIITPADVTIRDLRLISGRPVMAISDKSAGIYVPGRPPIGSESRVRLENVYVEGFKIALDVASGATGTTHRLLTEIERSELVGEQHAISCWNDQNGHGNKALHVNNTKLRNRDKTSDWSSHLIYHHPQINIRMSNVRFHEWASAKYGVQAWGGDNSFRPDYNSYDNCHWDASGDGPAVITTKNGVTQIRGGTMNSRGGVQNQGELHISGVVMTPTAGSTPSTSSCLSSARTGSVTKASDLLIDVSDVAPLFTIYSLGTALSTLELNNCHSFSTKRNQGLLVFGGAPRGAGQDHAIVRGRNVTHRGYRSTPEEWLDASKRSSTGLLRALHGDIELVDSWCTGSAAHDGASINLAGVDALKRLKLSNVMVETYGHGAALQASPSFAGQVTGTLVHEGKLSLTGGSWQRLRLPADGAKQQLVANAASLAIGTTSDIADVSCPTMLDAQSQQTLPVPTIISSIYVNGQMDDTAAYVGATMRLRCIGPWTLGMLGNVNANTRLRVFGEIVTLVLNESFIWDEVNREGTGVSP